MFPALHLSSLSSSYFKTDMLPQDVSLSTSWCFLMEKHLLGKFPGSGGTRAQRSALSILVFQEHLCAYQLKISPFLALLQMLIARKVERPGKGFLGFVFIIQQ